MESHFSHGGALADVIRCGKHCERRTNFRNRVDWKQRICEANVMRKGRIVAVLAKKGNIPDQNIWWSPVLLVKSHVQRRWIKLGYC